jgi:hypothetical protein
MNSNSDEYHGIVINLSQKDQSIFKSFNIIGKKKVIFNLLVINKISVHSNDIEKSIKILQENMRYQYWPFIKGFYFHFYQNNELIVVFKDKVFHIITNPETWKDAIEYGINKGIPKTQLDFFPCKIADEMY